MQVLPVVIFSAAPFQVEMAKQKSVYLTPDKVENAIDQSALSLKYYHNLCKFCVKANSISGLCLGLMLVKHVFYFYCGSVHANLVMVRAI